MEVGDDQVSLVSKLEPKGWFWQLTSKSFECDYVQLLQPQGTLELFHHNLLKAIYQQNMYTTANRVKSM